MIEQDRTNVNLDRIFEEMYNLINNASRIPLSDKIVVDESDLVGLMDDLKEAIPKEIKSASQILEEQKTILNQAYVEQERIIAKAKAEGENIIKVAEAKAERIVEQEAIVEQAKVMAEEIHANAEAYQKEVQEEANIYAETVKRDALQYVDDMLDYFGQQLTGALQGLQENRKNVREAQDAIDSPLFEDSHSKKE